MFGNFRKINRFSCLVLAVLIASLIFPSVALADDAVPPTPESTGEEVPLGGGPETGSNNGEATIEPVGAAVSEDAPAVESVADVVQALAQADAVLADAQGDPLPLVSEQAKEALSNSDPYFDDGTGTIVGYSATGICPAIVDVCNTSTTPLQAAIDAAPAGAVVLVEPGTYNESPNITKSLTLQSTGSSAVTTINLQAGSTYLGSFSISGAGADVTIDGFTIVGFDAVGNRLASSNIFISTGLNSVTISNNHILVGNIGAGSNGDDGMGVLTTYNTNAANDVGLLTLTGNLFEPLNGEATRAFYVNPGVDRFVFDGNEITGDFNRAAITQAKDGTVSGNTVTGTGASAGIGTWGYPDADVYGQTVFADNTISGTGSAISIYDTNNVFVQDNFIHDNGTGVNAVQTGWVPGLDASTITITGNSFEDNTVAVSNGYSNGVIDATGNFWGDATGPMDDTTVPDDCGLLLDNPFGGGNAVSQCVIYDDWLTSDPFIPPSPDDPGDDSEAPAPPSGVIPVTGGQRTVLGCHIPLTTLQLGEILVTFYGLCGYEAILDPVFAESLPEALPGEHRLMAGVTITIHREGQPVESLPPGAALRLSYPLTPDSTLSILGWEQNDWRELVVAEVDGRIESLLDGPGTFVIVTD